MLRKIKKRNLLPWSFRVGLKKVRLEQSDWSVHRLVDPRVIFLSQVSDLPSQWFSPVYQILQNKFLNVLFIVQTLTSGYVKEIPTPPTRCPYNCTIKQSKWACPKNSILELDHKGATNRQTKLHTKVDASFCTCVTSVHSSIKCTSTV